MQSRHVSLILMAINLGLVGTLGYMVYAFRFSPSLASAPVKTTIVTNTVTQIAVRKINSTNNLLAAIGNRLFNWRAIESTNYVQYIENLRNFGCPEETIRDIIVTDVAKSYARRRAALRAQLHPYRFWQTADPLTGSTSTSPELRRQLRLLDREERQLVRDLLGVDLRVELARYESDEDQVEEMDAFLAPDKLDQVRSVAEKYEDQEQEVYARSRGTLLAEDQRELRSLERQRRTELAAILSPAELEEYDLRHSDTANTMRSQMAGFQPNEEEFRKIFRLQRLYEEKFAQVSENLENARLTPAQHAQAEQEAQQALNDELKKTLGAERFTEYQRGQDPDYRSLLQLGERFSAQPDLITRVYNMKQAAEYFKLQVEQRADLTEDQRAQAVAALARETQRQVASTMGGEMFKVYQAGSGQWIDNLQTVDESAVPPPPQPSPGTTLPYDINLLPPELRAYLLNPPVFPRPVK